MCPKAKGASNVLDMGTGTGSWAMDYGKCHTLIRHLKLVLTS
jgi:ubiquinone/menaquinone biosynthesis C-methylase UbiE